MNVAITRLNDWRGYLPVGQYKDAGSEFDLRPGEVFMGLFACGWLPVAGVFCVFNQLSVSV